MYLQNFTDTPTMEITGEQWKKIATQPAGLQFVANKITDFLRATLPPITGASDEEMVSLFETRFANETNYPHKKFQHLTVEIEPGVNAISFNGSVLSPNGASVISFNN